MVATNRVKEIFEDAVAIHQAALAMLAAGDIRDAAEKAWCATKRATDALILARTGEEPGPTALTSNELDALAREDSRVVSAGRYYSRRAVCRAMLLCGELQPHTERKKQGNRRHPRRRAVRKPPSSIARHQSRNPWLPHPVPLLVLTSMVWPAPWCTAGGPSSPADRSVMTPTPPAPSLCQRLYSARSRFQPPPPPRAHNPQLPVAGRKANPRMQSGATALRSSVGLTGFKESGHLIEDGLQRLSRPLPLNASELRPDDPSRPRRRSRLRRQAPTSPASTVSSMPGRVLSSGRVPNTSSG